MTQNAQTTRLVLVAIYLAGMIAEILLLNTSNGIGWWPVVIMGATSTLLGLGTGQPAWALLAFLAIPLAVPFGAPEEVLHEAFPVWFSMAFYAFYSSVLILITAFARKIVDSRRALRNTA
ncbi:MAG TPA: hypothetical protein VFX85_12370 [Solirubrobacterales bacterium]|nr:hypothetical protein [Solirubrobacterales bacterium]